MTDTVQLAIVAGIVAFAAGFPSWWQSMKNAAKAEETGKKVDAVIVKASEIHELANANLSKATNALEVANTKLLGLQAIIAGMADTKSRADAAAATASLVAKIPDQPKGPSE